MSPFPFVRMGRRKKNVARSNRSARRPAIEVLEGRALPSTITVFNPNDSGSGTLRDAIAQAADGDTIDFNSRLMGQTIHLITGELVIDKSLDIEGLGATNLAVSGDDVSRVFDITGIGLNVIIGGLTITHGRAAQGAGINDPSSSLTLEDVDLISNQAIAGPGDNAEGGGIFNGSVASLTLTGVRLENNNAIGNPTPSATGLPGGLGGGLYNEGNASITQGSFSANMATTLGGGFSVGGRGGAIWNGTADPPSGAGATLLITASTFSDNQASGTPSDTGNGGRALGGAIFNRYAMLSIDGSTFRGNRADAGDSAPGFAGNFGAGGAIANTTGGTVTIQHSRFRDNETSGSAAGTGAVGGNGEGGALYNETSLTMIGSIIANNVARGGAGAVGGFGFGGGITNFGSVAFSFGIMASNQALGGDGGMTGTGGNGSGGALRNDGFASIEGSLFLQNQVIGGAGLRGGDALGGAIRDVASAVGSLTVTNSALIANRASGGTGSDAGFGGNAQGGAIDNDGPTTLTLTSVLMVGNQAHGGDGGMAGNGQGGGLYVANGTVCIQDSLIALNRAEGGNGGPSGQDGQGVGGGIYIAAGSVGIQDSLVFANLASTSDDDIFGTYSGGC